MVYNILTILYVFLSDFEGSFAIGCDETSLCRYIPYSMGKSWLVFVDIHRDHKGKLRSLPYGVLGLLVVHGKMDYNIKEVATFWSVKGDGKFKYVGGDIGYADLIVLQCFMYEVG